MKLCLNCHIAILEPHKEYLWVKKCPICSFSEVEPGKDPLTKVPSLAGLEAVQQASDQWYSDNKKKT